MENKKEYVVIFLFTEDMQRVLLIHRNKAPYQGTYNGIGGKVRADEPHIAAAYRECKEETSDAGSPYKLNWMMTVNYPSGTILHVYYGKTREFELPKCDEGDLYWVNASMARTYPVQFMAGEGAANYFINAVLFQEGVLSYG